MGTMPGRVRVLAFLALSAWLGAAFAIASPRPERELPVFARRAGVPEALVRSSTSVEISSQRVELYGEVDGTGYAAVVYESGQRAVGDMGMEKLCSAALTRKYRTAIIDHVAKQRADSLIKEDLVRLSMSEIHLGPIRRLDYDQKDGCEFVACSTALENVRVPDMAARWDHFLAVASYGAAKLLVRDGQSEPALELLKNTRRDPAVYQNGLGYIIPLVAARDQPLSHRLRQEFLDTSAMTDPEATFHLAEHLQNGGDLIGAAVLYDICLRLDSQSIPCREGKASLDVPSAASPIPARLDYDSFFNQ